MEQKKGSTIDLVITLKGQEVATIGNGESVVVYLYPDEFMKLDAIAMFKGKPYTAGEVQVKNFFLEMNDPEKHLTIDLAIQVKDITVTYANSAPNPYPTNSVKYVRQTDHGSLVFVPTEKMALNATAPVDEPIAQVSDDRAARNKEIILIQPGISEGETVNHHQEILTVKGRITNPRKLANLLINGKAATVNEGGYFELDLKVPYTQYEILVNAFFNDNSYSTFKFFTNREWMEEGRLENPEIRLGNDYALIIATNEYNELNNLRNPIFDSRAIAEELRSNFNYQVETVFDPTIDEIYSVLKEYAKRTYSDDDQLFIFFAGHGEFDNYFKEGYICAKDTRAKDEGRTSYISHSNLRTIINNIPAQHIFLAMDVCFGGTFDPSIASRGVASEYAEVQREVFIKRKMQYKTRLYLTSGGKTYVPDGRPGYHSPFARRFLEALRSLGGEDGILTYREILGTIEKVTPEPRFGEFGDNEPGSDFLFIH